MKTLYCKEFGPVENLVWEEAESPEPSAANLTENCPTSFVQIRLQDTEL
mgnify:CR=1 FL=1